MNIVVEIKKRKWISFCSLICCCILNVGCRLKNPNKEVYHDAKGNKDTYMSREADKEISDYTPNEILFIVNSEFRDYDSFYTRSSGTVHAKKGIISYNQEVHAQRWKFQNEVLLENLSTSSLVNVGEQAFFANDHILLRKAKKVQSESATWENTVRNVTHDKYIEMYGEVPMSFMHYVLNENTILSSKLLSFNSEQLIYEYVLDNVKSVPKYQIKMKTNGDLADYPKFQKIVLTLMMNTQFQPIQISFHEE